MTIKNRLGTMLALIALLAAGLLALLAAEEPAQAAFPGKNGKIAFVNGDDIWTMNPDATEQTNLTNSPEESDSDPAFSPDGTKIAFSREDAGSSTGAVYVMDADGSDATRLAPGRAPAFSPDGEKIAYTVRNQDNTAYDIYVMKADGTEQTKITDGSGSAFDPAFSPDGTKIAYAGIVYSEDQPFGSTSIFVANVDGSESTELITDGGYHASYSDPDWSPDSSRIAFAYTESSSGRIFQEVYMMNVDGSGQTLLARGFGRGDTAFSPDGQKIVFSSSGGYYESDDTEGGIYAINPDGSGETQILAGRSYAADWGVALPGSVTPPLPPPLPDTVLDSGPSGTVDSAAAKFEFSSDKEGSTFECSLDEAAFEECSSPEEITDLPEGEHTFRVRATDADGRTDRTPASRTWTVDTAKPRIFDLSPEPRSSIGRADPAIKATVRDDLAELSEAEVRLFVNGKEVPETKFSYDGDEDLLKYQPSKLPKGKNKIKVVAKDEAGNVGSRSWDFTVR